MAINLALVVMFLCTFSGSHAHWNPYKQSKTRVVDARQNDSGFKRVLLGTTNLWNGTKGENTDALISSFNHVLRKHFKKSHLKYTVSSNARLIAVNLLSPNFDSWKVEAKLAKQQENVEIWGSTLQGSLIQPSSIPQDSFEAAAFKVDEWVDPFARILLDIRRAMYDDTHYSDTIIAIHCQRGVDRTGELVAAYRTAFLGWSLRQSLEETSSARAMMEGNALAVLWWNIHLTFIRDRGGAEPQWAIPIGRMPKKLRLRSDDFMDGMATSSRNLKTKAAYAHSYDAGKNDARWNLPDPKHGDDVFITGDYARDSRYEFLWYRSDPNSTTESLISVFEDWKNIHILHTTDNLASQYDVEDCHDNSQDTFVKILEIKSYSDHATIASVGPTSIGLLLLLPIVATLAAAYFILAKINLGKQRKERRSTRPAADVEEQTDTGRNSFE